MRKHTTAMPRNGSLQRVHFMDLMTACKVLPSQ
jgi:hypothetical protein